MKTQLMRTLSGAAAIWLAASFAQASHYAEQVARTGGSVVLENQPVTIYLEQFQNPGCPQAVTAELYLGINGSWSVHPMTGSPTCDPNGSSGSAAYTCTIPAQAAGTTVEYVVRVSGSGSDRWLKAGSNPSYNRWDKGYTYYGNDRNFRYTVGRLGPSSYHWPLDGELDARENLWINFDVESAHALDFVAVVFSVNGGAWQTAEMTQGEGQKPYFDHWYANLGGFAGSTVLRYAIVAVDAYGVIHWDNNADHDYVAEVNAGGGAEVSRLADGSWLRTVGSGGSCGYAEGNVWIDIAVRDLGPNRQVGIVWSADGGASWFVTDAASEGNLGGGDLQYGVDVLGADTITNCPGGPESFDFRYAIFYSVGGVTYWDNNGGQDYVIHVGL